MATSQQYQKLDPISHIHKRPDMYIGSLKPRQQNREWFYHQATQKMVEASDVVYSDGLLRIFVEALSNAIDNTWRSRKQGVRVSKIKVTLDPTTGKTSLWNDGLHIPVEMHPTEKMYNPELIFGHLMTGSNLNDEEERLSSGRNGLGIKLLNVFSKTFKVEIYDPVHQLLYKQKWSRNMRECSPPVIKPCTTKKEGYTMLQWVPDFEKFDMTHYDDTILSLYKKFCIDASMITQLPVHVNDEKYHIKTLADYARLYRSDETPTKELLHIHKDGNDESYKTSIVLLPSPTEEYREIGFVNGVYTKDGGVHVDAVSNEIFRALVSKFSKHPIYPKDVRPYFYVFVNAWLTNPEFGNQSKTKLLAPPLPYKVEAKHVQQLMKWSFVDKIHTLIKEKEFLSLKKSEKKGRVFKRIEGLDSANYAGTKNAHECTLILCEGLSAKTYAANGINVGIQGKKGRNYFGIYPLRGKCLNVRNASVKSISENKEITDIIQALNLKHGLDYRVDENYRTLSYGRVLIITDADEDGHHISSLILNFFHRLFPSLLERQPSFLQFMMTPIAKIFHGNKAEITFYNDYEYQKALEEIQSSSSSSSKTTKPRVKYYKGLGTSSDQEVRETFGQKVVSLIKDETTDKMMEQLFHKHASNERKEWLTTYDPASYQTPAHEYPLTLYFNQELIKFSIEDCRRSIPNIFDGLKVSQRKILYAVFKKNLSFEGKSMKVAQLAGYCAEHSNYHHGEQCLHDTIIKMTHHFPGSNNLPYLARDGQFGSRAYLGKDAANARYIFTKLAPLTRLLFPKDDDDLLPYTLDDGDRVQPDYYVPILPTILGNGCLAGIGTGWSCSVPCFDFIELANKVRQWLEAPDTFALDLNPYYYGFKGEIKKVGPGKYESYGILRPDESSLSSRKKKTLYRITELPIHMATNKYKEELEQMVEQKKLKQLQNFCTPDTIDFVMEPAETFVPTIENMKLKSGLSITNMVLFQQNDQLQKFDSIEEIFQQYAMKRLDLYTKRKQKLIRQLELQLLLLRNKRRFLQEVQQGAIRCFQVPETQILEQLVTAKYDTDPRVVPSLRTADELSETGEEGGYQYLLKIPIREFSKEKIHELEQKISHLNDTLCTVKQTTEQVMWKREIDVFLEEYRKHYGGS